MIEAQRPVQSEPREHDPDAPLVDWPRLESNLSSRHERYMSARPFPHIVLDDFLTPEAARRATAEFPRLDGEHWINYLHVNEHKYANTDIGSWGSTLQDLAGELTSPRFVRLLQGLTGIGNLFVDHSMEGGGLHQSVAGGFLNVHADFTVHPRHRDWRRRVNVLVYLNDEWPPAYGGDLEFWSADMKRRDTAIAPIGNRAVIFNTDDNAFHGHPEPLRCPPGVARQSLALYYFTVENDPVVRSTDYRPRPGEGLRSLLIYLDKHALRAYDRVKRSLGLSDRAASRLLARLPRFRRRPR